GAVALAPRQLDPLDEVALLKLAVELPFAQEPVVAAMLLAGATRPGRRGDGELEPVDPLDQHLRERALAFPRRPGKDEDRPRPRLSGRRGQSAPSAAGRRGRRRFSTG